MKNLKTGYQRAINWRNQTGQGVEDGDSIVAHMHKLCPHFDDLDQIFGHRPSQNVPVLIDSGKTQNELIVEIDEDDSADFLHLVPELESELDDHDENRTIDETECMNLNIPKINKRKIDNVTHHLRLKAKQYCTARSILQPIHKKTCDFLGNST